MILLGQWKERRMAAESEELIELMEKIEAKGLDWEKVAEQIKVKHDILMITHKRGGDLNGR